ncbi:hypothetical protein WA588_004489, partial [Blastocystis sp. NMH]
MGVIAICLVSLKGEIGCVVKNSLVSYQRITSILHDFSSAIEDIRISCKNKTNSVLGGKRIDDVYPIAQPIPMVIGAYRLLYLLVNDLYIITIDIDHHSPFLALDVMDKVKDVVSKSMDGRISFSEVEKKKIYYYYAFRRCINGIEGASVIGVALRKIRLADDPLTVYIAQNELININDCLHAGEIPNEVRNGRRDAWEAVIQLEGRIPADAKKELKAAQTSEPFDAFFDVSAELPNHQVPETATTPMADLIVDEAFDAATVTAPLTRLQSELAHVASEAPHFSAAAASAVQPAASARCSPPDLSAPKETGGEQKEEEEEEEEEEVAEEINVAVPSGAAVAAAAEEEEAEEEAAEEALMVVQIDGKLQEQLRVEETPEGITKQILKGELLLKPTMPAGIKEGSTALRVTFTNAAAYEFTPEEGKSRLLEDKGEEKLFEITLPTTTPEEPVPVLVYKGPVPAGMEPCSAKAHSSREEAVTSAVVEVYCKGSFPYSVDTATCVVAPPLVSNDTSIKRTFRFKPKGGFLKTSMKCRWTDQYMEPGNSYTFSAEVTEPVDVSGLPASRAEEACPCEVKGKFNGYVSGVRPIFGTDPDTNLGCTYQKREVIAVGSFTHVFS